MTLDRYADWLARGRAHQARRELIDALLCYRRAVRETSGAADARFHLGEIAWQLGDRADAIAAWQRASELTRNHLPSLHALADALAVTGQFEASLRAAVRVLALRSREPRASALASLLRAALGQPVTDAALSDALEMSQQCPLALLSAVSVRLLSTGTHQDNPRALARVLEAAMAAPIPVGGEDAMRAIALALARAGDAARARAAADRYADACRALHRPAMPLPWPVRTAGSRARVGLLVDAAGSPGAGRIATTLRRLTENVRVTEFVIGDAGMAKDAIDARVLPTDPDVAAKAMAALDLDVLIDLAGLRAASGPLLARRPARAIWAAEFDEGAPRARTLADRVFSGDAAVIARELAEALDALHAGIAGRSASSLTAENIATAWEDAVRSHQRGEVSAAKAAYARVLDAQPGFGPALYLDGVLARADHDLETARGRFRAAIGAAPAFVEAQAALADLEVQDGNAATGATIARQAIAVSPGAASLWRALGMAELKRGDARAAAEAFAGALERDPAHGETHYNHGVSLQMLRDTADAARAYQRALAFGPDLVAAHFNLGVIFDQLGNAGAAIAAFSNVLERDPTHVAAYKALAETLLASGRIDAWFANFERFERHCPSHIALAAHALEVCAYRADFAKLGHYIDGLRNERFTDGEPLAVLDALGQLLYLLHFFDVEPELIGRHARTHDALARSIHGEPRPRNVPRRPGRLRIGYLSGDFRNHVMGKMMWGALRHHDRDRFDVFGYATIDARDEWTQRYESIFGRFAALGTLSDSDAASRIGDDDLDVLIDLSTHTKGARPGILAAKPARVQITHAASAGTLAMSAIDFKLTDRYADVDTDPGVQIERPLAMEGCLYPYRHVAPSAAGVYTRERLGLAPRAIVIGAFCTPLKLSQRCLALWRDVLSRVPAAVLAFSPVNPALRPVFLRIGAAAGIEARRIVFVPQGRDDAENQARYRLVDFVLDPVPYGGVNGTLEAVDMGVPVVTLVGRRHAERSSYSILWNLGVTDTIAQTGGDYVEIAVRLATDPAFMRDVRLRIERGIARSALTDLPAHTRNLERAYVAALEQCAPEALDEARRSVPRFG